MSADTWQIAGSLADWTTAIVAILAFVAAAIAAKATVETNRAQQEALNLQRAQYQDSVELLRRAQAEKVTFWATWESPSADDLATFQVGVINASESPIYEVFYSAENQAGPPQVVAACNVVLPTGATPVKIRLLFPSGARDSPPSMYFRDAAGRTWMRDSIGTLRAVPRQSLMRFAPQRIQFMIEHPQP